MTQNKIASILIFALCVIGYVGSASAMQEPLIKFDKYHSVEEFDAYLKNVAERYPRITTLVEIGRSRAGHPIYALEINEPNTGPAKEKPAFYNDGNIHGGELSGGEAALYFINDLLTGYPADRRIRSLVEKFAFYNVPLVNPDGRRISTETPENHRWNIRPLDEDGDGLEDEDGAEDIDGDGMILQMRVPDPNGRWTISPDDPRLMVGGRGRGRGRGARGGAPTGPPYQVYSEGIDNDGDGRINEDTAGGVDLNRNFPSNWYAGQFASGPFPLSEPESYALVKYITERPNIAAIHTYHTSGGMILRFPTLADQDWDYPQSDLEDLRQIAEDGVAHTGYRNYAFEKKVIVDTMNPGHGVFNDWASNIFGVPAITTEMWMRGPGRGEAERMKWNDEVMGGSEFVDWKPFDHPTLGAIEIGGWKRWIAGSPPEPKLLGELERNNAWLLTFAEKLPKVEVDLEFEFLDLGLDDRGGIITVKAAIANTGWLATSTAHSADVQKLAKPVIAHIKLTNAELMEGSTDIELGVLPGAREDGPIEKHIEWKVQKIDGSKPWEVEVIVTSEKAGQARFGPMKFERRVRYF